MQTPWKDCAKAIDFSLEKRPDLIMFVSNLWRSSTQGYKGCSPTAGDKEPPVKQTSVPLSPYMRCTYSIPTATGGTSNNITCNKTQASTHKFLTSAWITPLLSCGLKTSLSSSPLPKLYKRLFYHTHSSFPTMDNRGRTVTGKLQDTSLQGHNTTIVLSVYTVSCQARV